MWTLTTSVGPRTPVTPGTAHPRSRGTSAYFEEMSLRPATSRIVLLAGVLVIPSARAADPVVIVSPQNGAVLPPAFTVKVTYDEVDFCDTDGCMDVPANQVILYVDQSPQDECDPCVGGEAEFTVMLEPGPHELRAAAGYQTVSELSGIVKITVDASATTEASDSASSNASDDSGSEATSEGDSGSKDGCACSADPGSNQALPWFCLTCLWASRGRRKQSQVEVSPGDQAAASHREHRRVHRILPTSPR
jgi:hypothetical protein